MNKALKHVVKQVAIIGGGPAGLMAAEIIAQRGHTVTVYERMPSLARKLLMAGRGGLNLTHSEDLAQFIPRYREAADHLRPAITAFTPDTLRAWCEGLGQPTFIGSSGRVFPQAFKASPLLRAWQARLADLGVSIRLKTRWTGWDEQNRLVFTGADGQMQTVEADAVLLALGGASWPKLGSDGHWTDILAARGVPIHTLRPANCGFTVGWSDIFRQRFAGTPIKPLALSFGTDQIRGEAMITDTGIEGGAIYALSAPLREAIEKDGHATLNLDLRPDLALDALEKRLSTPRGRLSLSNHLRKSAGLSPVAIGLLREAGDISTLPPDTLAARIKALPLRLNAPFGLERAISSAGGIALDALDDAYMLKNLPGVFCAGEMLDWEAPTGGYLLQASFATAVAAAQGLLSWLGPISVGDES